MIARQLLLAATTPTAFPCRTPTALISVNSTGRSPTPLRSFPVLEISTQTASRTSAAPLPRNANRKAMILDESRRNRLNRLIVFTETDAGTPTGDTLPLLKGHRKSPRPIWESELIHFYDSLSRRVPVSSPGQPSPPEGSQSVCCFTAGAARDGDNDQ